MSAHAGIMYGDGRHVPADVLVTLTETCQPYGPDGGGVCSPGTGLALIYRRLQVTPEDYADVQPVETSRVNWLTWDGRLDNRDDLMIELGLRPTTPAPTDAQIAARAFDRWGEASCDRLIGDWSLAVWDAGHRRLTLACDFMGVRPLYYVIADSYIAWSTAMESLAMLTGHRIVSLGAGHVVSFDREQPRQRIAENEPQRLWRLPTPTPAGPGPAGDRGGARDYVRNLRTLFTDAVAKRLRSSHTPWIELRDDWASSVTASVAARLAHSKYINTLTPDRFDDMRTAGARVLISSRCGDELLGVSGSRLEEMVTRYACTQALAVPPDAHGVVLTFPFADRRVLDYLATVPWGDGDAPQTPRDLLDAAFSPWLAHTYS